MVTFLISVIKIIFLLGILVFIHEGGHFLVAKLCKVKVNEFAIGFGPTILKKQGKETKYALRLIPLGGFVSMEGEEGRSDKEGSFNKASIPKKMAIMVAGGTVNIVFALIIYFAVAMTNTNYTTNKVESILDNSNAKQAGIKVNDEIIKINNKKIVNTEDILEVLENSNGEIVDVVVKRGKEKISYKVKPLESKYKETGIYMTENSSKVVALENECIAREKGLEVNDTILKINGEDVKDNPEKIASIINKTEGELTFLVKHHMKEKEINIIPEEKSQYYLGIAFKNAENTFKDRFYYTIHDTSNFIKSIAKNLKSLLQGDVSEEQLKGPIGISSTISKTKSLKDYVQIISLISLSLGITNLLPMPPLDGGKFILLLIEAIRRKSFKEETEIRIQTIGMFFIIGLAIVVTYNDILGLF